VGASRSTARRSPGASSRRVNHQNNDTVAEPIPRPSCISYGALETKSGFHRSTTFPPAILSGRRRLLPLFANPTRAARSRPPSGVVLSDKLRYVYTILSPTTKSLRGRGDTLDATLRIDWRREVDRETECGRGRNRNAGNTVARTRLRRRTEPARTPDRRGGPVRRPSTGAPVRGLREHGRQRRRQNRLRSTQTATPVQCRVKSASADKAGANPAKARDEPGR